MRDRIAQKYTPESEMARLMKSEQILQQISKQFKYGGCGACCLKSIVRLVPLAPTVVEQVEGVNMMGWLKPLQNGELRHGQVLK